MDCCSEYEDKLLGCPLMLYQRHFGGNLIKQRPNFTDVTLLVEDQQFDAHRIVLAASCTYFSAMLSGGMAEVDQRNIVIQEIPAEAFEEMLNFMYTGEISITIENCQNLLSAANMLQLLPVIHICTSFLIRHFHPSNIIGMYKLADTLDLQDLKCAAKSFICANFTKVVTYDEFVDADYTWLVEILRSEDLNIDHECEVLRSAVLYLDYKPAERRKLVFDVLKQVRLPLISKKQVEDIISNVKDAGLVIALESVIKPQCGKTKVIVKPRRCASKRIYFMGGMSHDGSTLASMDCFDLQQKKWLKKCTDSWQLQHSVGKTGEDERWVGEGVERWEGDMEVDRMCHSAVVMGKNIYVIGGECDMLIYYNVDCYDIATKTWEPVAPLNIARTGHSSVVLEQHIYTLGGCDGPALTDTIERYNPITNTWTIYDRLPFKRTDMAALSHEGLIYVAGGADDSYNSKCSFHSYNPVTKEWKDLADMWVARSVFSIVVCDGFIFAVGDGNSSYTDERTKLVERYDIEKDQWVVVGALQSSCTGSACVVHDGYLYVMGGHYGRDQVVDIVEVYDVRNDTWDAEKLHAPSARSNAVAVVA